MRYLFKWNGVKIIRSYCSGKKFENIPGPKQLPLVGNGLLFSPLGPYKVCKILDGFADLHKQFGDIIKLKTGKQESVLIFNPDDICTMFQHEGKFPKRPTFDALKDIRKKKYGSVGIVPDNGREWYKTRQHVQILLKLKTVHSYWHRQKAIAEDFSKTLFSKCNSDGIVKDFIQHAFLYSLEAIGVVCYGKRLICIASPFEEYDEIVKANIHFLKALGETFHQPPWWKIWKTKAYKTIEDTQDFMMSIAVDYLKEARNRLIENPESFEKNDPVLFHLLQNQLLSETEKNLLVTEIFQGGIDATGTVLTMMLYELARNPSIQTAIYEELKDDEIRPGHFPPLLRACLKETLRLHPTAGGTSRIIDTDAILSGYNIPKGTLVIGVNPNICRMDRYFSNPLQFNPSRWLVQNGVSIHPYSSLPFGHGARMCPGRRFAEQEILLAIAEIILKYRVVPLTLKDIPMILAMNLVPSEPIDFQLIMR